MDKFDIFLEELNKITTADDKPLRTSLNVWHIKRVIKNTERRFKEADKEERSTYTSDEVKKLITRAKIDGLVIGVLMIIVLAIFAYFIKG